LDSATQLLYDDRQLFINGEAMAWPARGSQLLKRLANHRQVGSAELRAAAAFPLLHRWYCDGFVRLD
jgi:50S ribosomal protein L16 3-hydroxylase